MVNLKAQRIEFKACWWMHLNNDIGQGTISLQVFKNSIYFWKVNFQNKFLNYFSQHLKIFFLSSLVYFKIFKFSKYEQATWNKTISNTFELCHVSQTQDARRSLLPGTFRCLFRRFLWLLFWSDLVDWFFLVLKFDCAPCRSRLALFFPNKFHSLRTMWLHRRLRRLNR